MKISTLLVSAMAVVVSTSSLAIDTTNEKLKHCAGIASEDYNFCISEPADVFMKYGHEETQGICAELYDEDMIVCADKLAEKFIKRHNIVDIEEQKALKKKFRGLFHKTVDKDKTKTSK